MSVQHKRIRIGIDVGGTFTDIVAYDVQRRAIVGILKVPTTHAAPSGVAQGIVEGLEQALREMQIAPEDIAFIAHSTTQATNALLEADVAHVGVVGLVSPRLSLLERRQLRFAPIALGANAKLGVDFEFVSSLGAIGAALERLKARGVTAVAASAPFGVDDTAGEDAIVEAARAHGLVATSGHEVASLYGLRARTRTAALNAAMLPRMLQTARMTAQAVERAAIRAPLMIMRSDGGVMDVREVERRPILTMLSGPAAGVAGALLYESVTDGIFIEVGGTSADCSVIRHGMPQMRPARIGGHRLLVRTLDVRTLGIAGGSMLRVGPGGVRDVGPRSAHIAGCQYASFVKPSSMRGARLQTLRPTPRDPDDYVVLAGLDGTRIAITPTCAANALDLIPAGAFARGDRESARLAFALLAEHLGSDPDALAHQMLKAAALKLRAAIDELIVDYELDRSTVVIIGGGGGCGSVVPYAAREAGFEWRIARDAEVISPIGVALALVRDAIERTMVDPQPSDILRVRREAADAAIAAGAAPDDIEVVVEIDRRRNIVRATASGTTALVEAAATQKVDRTARLAAAARALRADESAVSVRAETDEFVVAEARRSTRGTFGIMRTIAQSAIVDDRGTARAVLDRAQVATGCVRQRDELLRAAIDAATAYGDVGRAMPDVFMLHGAHCTNLSGVVDADQAIALAEEELAGRADDAPLIIVTAPKAA